MEVYSISKYLELYHNKTLTFRVHYWYFQMRLSLYFFDKVYFSKVLIFWTPLNLKVGCSNGKETRPRFIKSVQGLILVKLQIFSYSNYLINNVNGFVNFYVLSIKLLIFFSCSFGDILVTQSTQWNLPPLPPL